MAKVTRKKDLPRKICIVCKRPFVWRKKWEKDWDQVKYCSERCRKSLGRGLVVVGTKLS